MSAIAIFAALILHKAIRVMAHSNYDEPLLGDPNAYFGQKSTLMKLLEYFALAVTIVIVAVPEGLPMAVSISLAYSVDKMKKDSILVKNLEAPEKMAGVEEICTGKTSTLTAGDMSVAAFYTEGKLITVDRPGVLFGSMLSENSISLLKDSILYNCDARVEMSDEATYEPEGNPTECGMLYFL
jgi:magnesium-transporting ATPase (P-type)